MTKKLFTPTLALLFLLLSATLAAAQSPGVAGDWEITLNSPTGSRNLKAAFKQDGEKLSGVFKGERGELPFEGTIKGKELKFSYKVKFQDNDLNITMTGNLDGDSI